MIICQCTQISDRDIDAAIDWMRASDPEALITPGKIFHALGKSADCGGCLRLFATTMRSNENFPVPDDVPILYPSSAKRPRRRRELAAQTR
ncbi:MAG: (2Fe-2S)-binding protein [Pseudomonadota bacterium]